MEPENGSIHPLNVTLYGTSKEKTAWQAFTKCKNEGGLQLSLAGYGYFISECIFLYNESSCPRYLDYLSTKIVIGWKIRMSLYGLCSQLCGENNHVELSFFILRKMCSKEHKILETHSWTLRKRTDSVTFPILFPIIVMKMCILVI